MDHNSLIKIIESRITILEGGVFQSFCDRLCLTLFPGDYTSVRAAGPEGDHKNDGYCPTTRTFFAAHATRGEADCKTKTKIKDDLEGCLKKHSDVKTWIFLTNTTLIGSIESFVDTLRKKYPKVKIETWDHQKISLKISTLKEKQIEYVLDILGINTSENKTEIKKGQADAPRINNLEKYIYFLEHGHWVKEFINENEIWICREDPMFQIEELDDSSDFTEPWTQVYPDKFGSGKNPVNLTIYGVPIKQLYFIYCDGGRINVPMPELKTENDKIKYYWNKNSIEYKVARIIGSFYIYDNIEGVAAMSKIDIV